MYIDLKTHLFTIIATFLALAVGIVIGSQILTDAALLNQQEILIRRLESQINQIRTADRSNQALIDQLKNQIQELTVQNQVLSRKVISGRLAGRNIIYVQLGAGELHDGLISAIHESGARQLGRWIVQLPADQSVLAPVETAPSNLDHDAVWWDVWLASIFRQYVDSSDNLRTKDPINQFDHALDYVMRRGWLEWQSFQFDVPVWNDRTSLYFDNVIFFVNEADPRYYPLLRSFIQIAKQSGVHMAAVETSQAATSMIPFWQAEDITSVDAVDLGLGQVAIVLALESGKSGSFGTKATAEAVLPHD